MKYTEDHEWLRVEGDLIVVGITEHAATQLGDVVFVELPETETMVASGDEVVVIESVKAASDILAPIEGEIVYVMLSRQPATPDRPMPMPKATTSTFSSAQSARSCGLMARATHSTLRARRLANAGRWLPAARVALVNTQAPGCAARSAPLPLPNGSATRAGRRC